MAAFLQRFPECKTVFFGTIAQRTVPGTKILCSGFWGSARHLNYRGEIVQVRARVHVGLRHSNPPRCPMCVAERLLCVCVKSATLPACRVLPLHYLASSQTPPACRCCILSIM